jgi:hypothetical protein
MLRSATPLLLLLPALAAAGPCKDEPKPAAEAPVKVTLVVILANKTDAKINPKLATLAEEVQKRNKEFTGFGIHQTLDKSIPIGKSHSFELPEKQTATITAAKGRDKDGRIELTVKLPGLDEVTYTCVCDKFFPIVTPFVLKSGETVLVAILAKPCTGK